MEPQGKPLDSVNQYNALCESKDPTASHPVFFVLKLLSISTVSSFGTRCTSGLCVIF
jgi:hypothetical protein